MQMKNNVRMLCSRVQTILRRRQRKQQQRKPTLEISAPFDFKREAVCLPGISEDEISILREKAAASRIGVAEAMPPSPSSMLAHARPVVTVMAPNATTSTTIST
jgi:hypothetical protein